MSTALWPSSHAEKERWREGAMERTTAGLRCSHSLNLSVSPSPLRLSRPAHLSWHCDVSDDLTQYLLRARGLAALQIALANHAMRAGGDKERFQIIWRDVI